MGNASIRLVVDIDDPAAVAAAQYGAEVLSAEQGTTFTPETFLSRVLQDALDQYAARLTNDLRQKVGRLPPSDVIAMRDEIETAYAPIVAAEEAAAQAELDARASAEEAAVRARAESAQG
jgi:hypothetical protein